MSDSPVSSKAPKSRSPAFPFIPLEASVERLVQLERTFTRHPIPAAKSGLAWDMKEGSSQAFQTLAALKYFGLIEYQGSAESRQAIISERGRTYLRAQQDSIKRQVLKEAALMPKAISEHWEQWGAKRPPDPVCLDDLILKEGYTHNAAETFLKVYDETIAFAGLTDSGTVPDVSEEPEAMQQPQQQEIQTLQKLVGRQLPAAGGMTVTLNGDFLEVSAVVDLKGAKRLLKAIKANIALLEDDDDEEDES
jgi:hypothetical protein